MATFKNIRIKMKGGKSRMQRVKVLASGKYKFVKNIKTKSSRKSPKSKTKKRKYKVAKKKRRRRPRRKIPFEVAIAGVAIPFTPAADGWETPFDALKRGDMEEVARSAKRGFLGIDEQGRFNLAGLINPFDFNEGRYVKMILAAAVVAKVRKSIIRLPMDKIPFLGKYIS